MLKIGKLHLHWSFFFFLALTFFLGEMKLFAFVVCATTLHELSHVFAAKAFGVSSEAVIVTPLGETAYLNGFDALPAIRKYVILAAGPLFNIMLSATLLIFPGAANGGFAVFAKANLAIGVFNLLPVYPLDGGKLLFLLLGNRAGILKSAEITRVLTKAGIWLVFFAGFAQVILFPLNISLIAIGIFLISIFEREKASMLFSYYKCMLGKGIRLREGLGAKTAVFSEETPASYAERIFTWDYYHIVYIMKNGEIIATLTEKQIFEACLTRERGEITKLLDILGDDAIIKSGKLTTYNNPTEG